MKLSELMRTDRVGVFQAAILDWADRVEKLENVAHLARIIVYEYSGESSLFVAGFVSKVMMAELAEALQEIHGYDKSS